MKPKHRYSSLRVKIIIMTLTFALGPLFVMGFTIYWQFDSAYTGKILEGLKNLAQSRKSSLDLFFDERLAQLTTVAYTQSVERLKDETYLNRVFNTIQTRSKSFIDIGVIDSSGNHLAYVGPHYEQLKSVNYSHEEWFGKVMSSGVYISDVFLGFRKIPHFIIAVSVLEGNKTWILRATINSDIIDHIVRGGQIGRSGDAFIVNGQNILQTPSRYAGKLLERPNTPDFSSSLGTHVEEITKGGERQLYATARIQSKDWVVVIRQDPREEMGPLFRARFVEAIILLVGILLVVSGTIFTTRSLFNELVRVEREKAESDEAVMQSSKMAALGKLAAGIAHEINNPLAVIGEKAGWMKDLLDKEDVRNSPNFQEFEDCIKKIERQVDRSRTITHRLLRFGRRMEPTQDMVDINQILAETITFLENEAHYRDIKILTQYESRLPQITTDPTQLQQVFLNIVNNAIDAVGKSGTITIRTSYDNTHDPFIAIEISDTGPGIPKEMVGRIFEPFFTTKAASNGTGLGLAISHSIMEKLGGRILVTSEEGHGTTFTLQVPAK